MTKHKILVPIDGSAFSKTVIPAIEHFFKPEDVELVLMEAVDVPRIKDGMPPSPGKVLADVMIPTVMPKESAHTIHQRQEQRYYRQAALEHHHKEALQETALPLSEAGYAISCVVGQGDPAQNILDYATNLKVDIIAMATHGATGLSRMLMGSVAHDVLQAAKVPVLLLRPF